MHSNLKDPIKQRNLGWVRMMCYVRRAASFRASQSITKEPDALLNLSHLQAGKKRDATLP
jgi:hypothetical protein